MKKHTVILILLVAVGGKERLAAEGLPMSDFGPRLLNHAYPAWLSQDRKLEDYYLSPYSYCAGNPIVNIDPDGNDWYRFMMPIVNIVTEQVERYEPLILYTECRSQTGMDEKGIHGESLGHVVMDVQGSLNEKLGIKNGKEGYIDGEGAITAAVTVYGPRGEDDIAEYTGFTMSSDFKKYGAIADGDYAVRYVTPGKSGKLKSNYAVNGGAPVDCVDGQNPSKVNPYSPTQKNGIYVHSTNADGFAGVPKAGTPISSGCILIQGGYQWNMFNEQIGKNGFKMILRR